jgi:hypothetical protein
MVSLFGKDAPYASILGEALGSMVEDSLQSQPAGIGRSMRAWAAARNCCPFPPLAGVSTVW